MCCLFLVVAPSQGKNVDENECAALQGQFADVSWELAAEVYKGDLEQPVFAPLQDACLPQTTPQSPQTPQAAQPAQTDPEGPASDQQWARVSKSVA